jgi:hypothetical protein
MRKAAAFVLGVVSAGCAHLPSEVSPNVAAGHVAALLGTSGQAEVVTDGRLLPEGAAPDGETVRLQDVNASLVVDLGGVRSLKALLLQASVADVYFVEASADGAEWRVCWRLPPISGEPEMRTRTTLLPRPVAARWLRVRATTTRGAAVSELQAFETASPLFPPLDLSRPNAALPLFPGITRERIASLSAALAGALVLAALWGLLGRRYAASAFELRLRRGTLLALAVAAMTAWPNFLNFHYYGFVHTWEVFHYYLGAKYLPELGYTRLYACTAVADAEDGLDLRGYRLRDLRDNSVVAATSALDRASECHESFSAGRWEDFRRDARFFRAAMGPDAWTAVRNDHGFNGTPAWALLGGSLAGLAPASRIQIRLLTFIDVGLVLSLVVVLGLGFGLEAACLGAGYFGLNALAPFGWTGGGFLRYDWLLCLVVGLGALRRERPVLAGCALGASAALRIFPACAIVGVALKAAVEALEERSLRPLRQRARFALGLAATGVALIVGPMLVTGRPRIWSEFAVNSAKHVATQSVNLVGLRVFLGYEDAARLELTTDPLLLDRFALWQRGVSAAQHAASPAQWAAAAAFVLLLTLAVRGKPDWVAAVLGIGLMPVLFQLSSYYYSALIAYAALVPLAPGVGLGLASIAWLTTVIAGLGLPPDTQYAWQSLAIVGFVVAVVGGLAWRRRTASGPPVGDGPVG